MEKLYPKGPQSVPENLTTPTSKYKLHAWMALAGLFTFVLLYFGLIYLFATTAIRSFQSFGSGKDALLNLILGVVMSFLALFMVKALFFIKRFEKGDDFEITAEQEPELFKFINEVADQAGAPRPHRVYLSPRVNASVFYDLSIINLIFPTKKNLEIGLGLVNTLTLNEFKAVLAHEFGHFAQKTMAVGRYVYVSRQIASHIVATRDWFDNLIRGISSVDIRIAWIGWLISIFVWCIRSVMDTLFTIVVLAERALSREMEFNADLVAVSLSGSDAIVNGLYKLEAADQAWEQSLQFGYEALQEGKAVTDVFNLQKYLIKKIGVVLDNPLYGNPPQTDSSSSQRIFKKHLAAPPKMWATHPSGFEREENAKRIYISAPQDDRSSWVLFKEAEELKVKMTKHIYKEVEVKDKQIEEISNEKALAEIDKRYNKVFFDPKYRGYYLKLALTRDVKSVEELYIVPLQEKEMIENIQNPYPESLKQELELFESKNEELIMLQALYDKVYDAPGGVILHEGKELKRKDLPEVIAGLKEEIKILRGQFLLHNKKLRTLHLKIAEGFDSSWVNYLKGLAGLIHYAEHSIANITDTKRVFDNTLNIVIADGKVSDSEMNRLLRDSNKVTIALDDVFSNTSKVLPDASVLNRMNAESWASLLEEFKLGYASAEHINSWIQYVGSWINLAVNSLEKLKDAALEEMIITEEKLANAYLNSGNPGIAPDASKINIQYSALLNGEESTLQNSLDLWDRFFSADGLVPSIARFTVAASIIGVALFAGHTINKTDLIVYNGLSIPVAADIAGESIKVLPYSHEKISIPVDDNYSVESRTEDGVLIEKFEQEGESNTGVYIYNIASAAVIQEWTIYYTTSRFSGTHEPKRHVFGAPRWFKSDADYFFTNPPETIEMTGYSEAKSILTGFSGGASSTLSLAVSREDSLNLIKSHILWDDNKSQHLISWFSIAELVKEGDSLLLARLDRNPNEVVTLRGLQDVMSAATKKKVCQDCEERYKKDPQNADLYYLAIRCMEDGPEQDKAFIEGYKKWPDNAWLSLAAGYAYTNQEDWDLSEKALRNAVEKEPALTNICVDIARIYRLKNSVMVENTWNSDYLNYISQIENRSLNDSSDMMYINLANGHLDDAISASEQHSLTTHSFILRLAAASDGASDDIIQRSFELKPEEGINMNSIAPTIGLFARKGKDCSHYMSLLRNFMSRDYNKFDAFLNALRNGTAPDKAEEIIKDLSIQTKGHAYVLGSVYLGNKCPKRWKEKATKFLFVTERPNFIF